MLTIAFPAAAFGTNCYVLAPAPGEECLIVDPGVGVEDTVREVLAQHRLRPAAVLLTHGHLDHVY
ncbi:MAG TPA: MBL fold metallo-hydrolase, partial [Pedococcus sp.]|nr:MBL fold metallo-hydrolase [Pedococcus sp.]